MPDVDLCDFAKDHDILNPTTPDLYVSVLKSRIEAALDLNGLHRTMSYN